jgi:putative tricarboxylic transport membrane protein
MVPLARCVNKKAAVYLVVLGTALFLLHAANNFEFERLGDRIGPNAWPLMILYLLIFVAVVGLVKSFATRQPQITADEQEADEAAFLRPREIYPQFVWLGIAATLGYVIAIPILGFFLSTVLFAAVLMYLSQYRNIRNIIILSVVFAVMFLFLFMRVVYVALPLGIEPFVRVSTLVMSAIGVH